MQPPLGIPISSDQIALSSQIQRLQSAHLGLDLPWNVPARVRDCVPTSGVRR
jgi:hypothetical protein